MKAAPCTFTFADLRIGQEAGFDAEVSDADIDRFTALSGDASPLHNDADFAVSRGFAGRVVHGAYLIGLVSRLVGMLLPGENGLLLGLETYFLRPVVPGMRLRLTGTVGELSEAVQAAVIAVRIRDVETGQVLVRGKVTVGFTREKPDG